MFSVLHISPNRDETLTTADNVSHTKVSPSGANHPCVALRNLSCEDVRYIWDGHVFVMNYAGRTVATYYLSPLEDLTVARPAAA